MRHILVTGANKGIGFAIAKAILTEHDDTQLLLGSRDAARGAAAMETLAADDAALAERVRAVELDVASDASVSATLSTVREALGGAKLHGIVNNAGAGFGPDGARQALEVNTRGVQRVCEAFIPLLEPDGGRIVIVSSAAGPNFVADCSEERQRFFLDASTEWEDLSALMDEFLTDPAAAAERGLGSNPYGLSKALVNTYTLQLARRYPKLLVNACTPGFIETDMTRGVATSRGATPAQLGMKAPDDGARAPLHLLFGKLHGSGHYYGSDAKRSPLDRYRAPGSLEYSE